VLIPEGIRGFVEFDDWARAREARRERTVIDFMTEGGEGESNERMTGVLCRLSNGVAGAWREPERTKNE
jgi:hypothetical protein